MRILSVVIVITAALASAAAGVVPEGNSPVRSNAPGEHAARWWPVQELPMGVVRTANQQEFPQSRAALQMMLQSVSGLAAAAVNARRGDEMVWVDDGNADLEDWYARFLAMHSGVEKRGTFGPWELVDRYAKRAIIKGYILYRLDHSPGPGNSYRPGMDCSVNVATSLAGLLEGVLVAEELEGEAKAHGLKLLFDARGKTQLWCFNTYKAQFNRRILCTQDPQKPHVRDLAIAQKVFTVYGKDEPIPAAMRWLEPLSPILGWNGGDEFATTELSTSWGHIQTATDWCMNLPLLMAGSDTLDAPAQEGLSSPEVAQVTRRISDPNLRENPPPNLGGYTSTTSAPIDWTDQRSAVSFISTDGDNVQWFEGNFFRGSDSYWKNPERGRIEFGWSCCFAQLAQLCPQAIQYAVATRSPKDSFVEWGGGYYYPDHFGRERPNRWELQAMQAGRTWASMKKTNTRIIGFNFSRYDTPEARRAYEVFAAQTDGLLAILVFQYAPYEAGAGEVFWVKGRNGLELPVITARYSIWEHANRERSGTPAKIAREIRQTVEQTPTRKLPRYDWAMVHAWSYFKRAPGNDENAEDMQQESAAANGGVRGYSPALWCAERLPQSIRVVSPEELVWRIRMQHNPTHTREMMKRLR